MKVAISLDRHARHVGRGNLFTRCIVCWVDASSISYNLIIMVSNIYVIIVIISNNQWEIFYVGQYPTKYPY